MTVLNACTALGAAVTVVAIAGCNAGSPWSTAGRTMGDGGSSAGFSSSSLAQSIGRKVGTADTDEAHGWLVTSEQPPFTFGQSKVPSINGAFAGLIGDPTASGDGVRTITFQAGPARAYQYICPMPGHAQMGMHGTFIVR